MCESVADEIKATPFDGLTERVLLVAVPLEAQQKTTQGALAPVMDKD